MACGGSIDSDSVDDDYDSGMSKTTSIIILDLLTPIVQVTWGHRYEPENVNDPGPPLYYPCHGFILDILMQRYSNDSGSIYITKRKWRGGWKKSSKRWLALRGRQQ